jgi:hypothetical protein
MMRISMLRAATAALVLLIPLAVVAAQEPRNLVADPSFELIKDEDQFGFVFQKWGGWIYEGDCEFRVGKVAHSGRHSCLLFGGAAPKIRIAQNVELRPGRYRVTAYLRGLDIGTGTYNATTEFMFDGRYLQLHKNGTFGWTKLTYVGEIKERKQAGPSFGLMAPGNLWVDDVTLERVGQDVPLTDNPLLGAEESPIEPPGDIPAAAVRCPECGYRNGSWRDCYACGASLGSARVANSRTAAPVKPIADFEERNPFSGGVVATERAQEGRKALRIDRSYVSLDQPQDWVGYDFLKAELDSTAPAPMRLTVEIRDASTRDYWTRVNYETVVPPGRSTLVVPVKQLYVGEKSRPGRMLDLAHVTRLVFGIADQPPGSLLLDRVRLERDDSVARVSFPGLHAFDFGPSTGPVMDGFTVITPATQYSKGRGYGLKDARIWRAFDALQPDPLYQDFLCIEDGGLAVDLPNGRYRVFVNIDSPSGFWGEDQRYRHRSVLAEGRPVVDDTMDFDASKANYFRFWNVEDRFGDNTFDKYQRPYFREKTFDVEVGDGQLNLEFRGENWACCVSAVVIFPLKEEARGTAFLDFVAARRRFYFDNYFKRVLHRPTGRPVRPTDDDRRRGFIVFRRDATQDVFANDIPEPSERVDTLRAEGFAGEYEPLTLAVFPLRDLGKVAVGVTELTGPGGRIPTDAIGRGFVSNRITRVTAEGSVYTIAPRLVMPGSIADVSVGLSRRFWLTVRTPADARPGLYKGTIMVRPTTGGIAMIPVEFRVRAGTLDPVDIPAGPFGYQIGIPWYEDDPRAAEFNQRLNEAGLRKLREYGFTAFSGVPSIAYGGFRGGKPILDFGAADAQMKRAKELGFMALVTYGAGLSGIDAYHQDPSQMAAAGFKEYPAFIKAIYSEIQAHAERNGWIPVYYNLADELLGDELIRSAENADAYRAAFPKGPPLFTGASSFEGSDRQNPHFRLSRALHVIEWNGHDEAAVKLLHKVGGDWAFYNGGNRWTYGTYMYKAAKQFGMRFRLSWHWNAAAGDPYYALDCREDDYAWCTSAPDGRLIPSVDFERLREGLDDYRRLLTLSRLASERPNAPASRSARALIDTRLSAFHLGQREHDALFPVADWTGFRRRVDDAIEALK